jgi:hypothetical protein
MYYVFTDENDMFMDTKNVNKKHEYKFQFQGCKTGLNINKIFDFIIKNQDETARYLKSFYVRIIIKANDSKLNIGYNDKNKISSDKIILSDRYYLYDPMAIKKFNIIIDSKFVQRVCSNGVIEFLEWWKNSGLPLEYDTYALAFASTYGHVNVLEWWKNSGLFLKYDRMSLDWASEKGQVKVLEWWKNSGLELKYDKYVMDNTSYDGHVSVLEWWKNSGLPFEYTRSALRNAFNNGHVSVLEWWKNSGLTLKYDYEEIKDTLYMVDNMTSIGSRENYVKVLEWWENSGLLKNL